jgi:hypothetical protein
VSESRLLQTVAQLYCHSDNDNNSFNTDWIAEEAEEAIGMNNDGEENTSLEAVNSSSNLNGTGNKRFAPVVVKMRLS